MPKKKRKKKSLWERTPGSIKFVIIIAMITLICFAIGEFAIRNDLIEEQEPDPVIYGHVIDKTCNSTTGNSVTIFIENPEERKGEHYSFVVTDYQCKKLTMGKSVQYNTKTQKIEKIDKQYSTPFGGVAIVMVAIAVGLVIQNKKKKPKHKIGTDVEAIPECLEGDVYNL